MRCAIRTILVLALCAALAIMATASASSTKHLSSFQTPTHNIGCSLLGGIARCDIRHRTWKPPPAPKSCSGLDFGQGIFVGKSGKGRFVCAGDTALNPHAAVLAYGQSDRYGRFVCQSQTIGITCTNTTNGHGFFESIQSYRLF